MKPLFGAVPFKQIQPGVRLKDILTDKIYKVETPPVLRASSHAADVHDRNRRPVYVMGVRDTEQPLKEAINPRTGEAHAQRLPFTLEPLAGQAHHGPEELMVERFNVIG